MFSSAGGRLARVQFSNVFGSRPLEIGRAALAPALTGASIAPGSSVALSFNGRQAVVIAPGASVISDPARLAVHPFERLALSVFLPRATSGPTDHVRAKQINYVAAGDRVLSSAVDVFTAQTPSWYFGTRLDVFSPASDDGTVVALGDSITDGSAHAPARIRGGPMIWRADSTRSTARG
jgi:hypothetical protein